jgi:hypothetical protein
MKNSNYTISVAVPKSGNIAMVNFYKTIEKGVKNKNKKKGGFTMT